MGARVLLVGGGAREHAIAWKLSKSPLVDAIFIAPGNPGTASVGTNLPIQPKDIDGLIEAVRSNQIDFYLATMDDPQPLGLVDRLKSQGVLCYGPSQAASQIEASKAWAKQFMQTNGVPTAASRSFSDYTEARRYVESLPDKPLWVKASGLAAGKGAIGCTRTADAVQALEMLMVRKEMGAAGETVVIEEDLQGWETSAQAFCDGTTAVSMPFATDYKRAQDGGVGLNTGGMGAYSPSAEVSPELTSAVRKEVIEPVIRGMITAGHPFNGTLYPGIMVTPDGIRVLEFNARFGDPETQVIIPRLDSDLFEVCRAAAEGKLSTIDVRWSPQVAVCVVMASGGYPATYRTGYAIEGLDRVDPDVLVFHAGTAQEARGIVTNGGRVLTVVGLGGTVAEARAKAYDNVKRIHFTDAHYRTDIALEAVT